MEEPSEPESLNSGRPTKGAKEERGVSFVPERVELPVRSVQTVLLLGQDEAPLPSCCAYETHYFISVLILARTDITWSNVRSQSAEENCFLSVSRCGNKASAVLPALRAFALPFPDPGSSREPTTGEPAIHEQDYLPSARA